MTKKGSTGDLSKHRQEGQTSRSPKWATEFVLKSVISNGRINLKIFKNKVKFSQIFSPNERCISHIIFHNIFLLPHKKKNCLNLNTYKEEMVALLREFASML